MTTNVSAAAMGEAPAGASPAGRGDPGEAQAGPPGRLSHPGRAPMSHPFMALLARYATVLRAAWQARHELAGPRRLADEAAFLPAAMELQEKPPHPAPRRLALALCLLFAVALAWAWVGTVDIVAVAPGRIIVSDRTKVVQPLEAGVVRRILVKDGDHVSQGQLLVELDATLEQADGERLGEELAAARAELTRAQALLASLDSGRLLALPADGDRVSKASARSQGADAALTRSEWAEISAKLARLQSEAQRRRAELETARRAVERLSATLPLALQREQDIQSLSTQGFMAGHAGQDRTRERVELERDLATARAREAEVQAGVAESDQATVAFRAETLRALNERAAQARLRLAQLTQESSKSQQRARQMQLLAPATGTVQQLAVHTAGGVVTPAQPLLVVVPDNSQVTAEVLLENKDVGFVNLGQAASIKFETFPYTRYGTVDAQVTQITADAVADEKMGAVFPVRLSLGQEFLNIDGKRIGVAPGMNLTAEIRTGSRRVIDYLWSPLQRHAEESLRER